MVTIGAWEIIILSCFVFNLFAMGVHIHLILTLLLRQEENSRILWFFFTTLFNY